MLYIAYLNIIHIKIVLISPLLIKIVHLKNIKKVLNLNCGSTAPQ